MIRDWAYGAAVARRLRATGIPAKILALAVEVIELQCCLLRCRSLFLALKSQAGPPLDGLLTGVLRTMTQGR